MKYSVLFKNRLSLVLHYFLGTKKKKKKKRHKNPRSQNTTIFLSTRCESHLTLVSCSKLTYENTFVIPEKQILHLETLRVFCR